MICPRCGATVEDASEHCPACRAGLGDVRSAPVGTGSQERFAHTAPDPPDARLDRPGAGELLPHELRLEQGQRFGSRYRIAGLLGTGGMGAVYRARDEELGIDVALKTIRSQHGRDPALARSLEQRFKRELLLARQVSHPNVVRIHDLGEVEGTKYITMAYVEGADLASVLDREGRLPAGRVVRIMRQVAAGLAAAHHAGVVHRDLKPSNIMIGAGDTALIMDFGISRSTTGELPTASGSGTMAGAVVGTVAYMAPEQAGSGEVDHRADIYAFGLICYDLLSGERPAPRDRSLTGLMERARRAPESLRTIDDTIPDPLARIVSRCLAPEPADRYQETGELVAALDELAEPAGRARRPQVIGPRALAGAAAAVLAIAGGAWWLFPGRGSPSVATESQAREPLSLLIADFRNGTSDPVFEGAVEQALTIAVEGAPFITAFSRISAQRTAAEIKRDAGLDESVARLVARREGIKVVLAGAIETDGSGYRISARAVDPTVDEGVLADETGVASDKADVLRVVASVADRLRSALGDTTPASARLAAAETFTAGSLDAMRSYDQAQDLAGKGRNEEAIAHYRQAVESDPGFGRAYSGWAMSAYSMGREAEATELWKKALSLMDRMTDRERYRTLGLHYLAIASNYQAAIENYSRLVALYPADRAGHSNLAAAYFYARNYRKALEHGRLALEIYPANLIMRDNYAVYAILAGDFDTAAAEARRVIEQAPDYDKAYERLALTAIDAGHFDEAVDAYQRMAGTGPRGASLAVDGLADLDLLLGRPARARDRLTEAVAQDRKTEATMAAASKLITLAEAHEAAGDRARALRAARDALDLTRRQWALVPAARLFARNGDLAGAQAIATELGKELQAEPRAFAQVIEAQLRADRQQIAEATDALRESVKLADLWIARFDLGVLYVKEGHVAEGLAELELCQTRRGEAMTMFGGDAPTAHYLAALPYWLGRAQEGVGMTRAAAASYQRFLDIRSDATSKDSLATDAKARLDALQRATSTRQP